MFIEMKICSYSNQFQPSSYQTNPVSIHHVQNEPWCRVCVIFLCFELAGITLERKATVLRSLAREGTRSAAIAMVWVWASAMERSATWSREGTAAEGEGSGRATGGATGGWYRQARDGQSVRVVVLFPDIK